MRRNDLGPARAIPQIAVSDLAPIEPGTAGGGTLSEPWSPVDRVTEEEKESPGLPVRGIMADPVPAREKLRRLFEPATGWFRALERRASQALGRDVYPYIPGIHWPYDRILDRGLTLSETEIFLPGLPAEFDGMTMLLISDVHAGPFLSPDLLARVFDRLLATRPDAVLLVGDMTSARIEDYLGHREAFRRLAAPLGVHGVLGNHDHYTDDPERLRGLMEQDGISLLHNRSIVLRRGSAELSLAGVDDLLVGAPDLDAALRDAEPPLILLSHNPDLLFEAARRGVALMLSGHTHAGQVRVPGLGVLVRQSRYRLDEGRFRAGETELVVSRGLGAVGIPFRLACPPEAVLVRLSRPR